MSTPKVSSSDGSTAIGGDVNAPVLNLNAAEGSTVNFAFEQKVTRELPSFLGRVIVAFSQQSLSEYALGPRRQITAEVEEKIKYNNLSQKHRVLVDYLRHSLVLEKAYLGVEQRNADARYLVRRKTAVEYEGMLSYEMQSQSLSPMQRLDFVRTHADRLIEAVVARLVAAYKDSNDVKVEQEYAHLAISLIVADAVIECEVLERPEHAPTP
jgi:hypothetical protein